MRGAAACLALLLAGVMLSWGQDALKEQQRRRSSLENDIAILRKQIGNTTTASTQAISSLNLIQAQKKSRQKLLKQQEGVIADYDSRIASLQRQIAGTSAILDTLQAHYSRLVLGAYKNRDVKIWYMYILSSDNLSQALRRIGYFKSLSSQIRRQAEKIRQLQDRLSAEKEELVSLRAQASDIRKQHADQVKKLSSDENQQKKLVSKLKRNSRAFQASLKAKQDEIKAIDRQIARMLSQASGSKGKKKKDIDYTLDASFENNRGKLPWPVDGPIAEHFGPYRNKELKINLVSNGINIACEEGSSIKAVFDGVVSNIMLAPGYGQCILIQHGTYYTSYCKVKTAHVRQGDKVKTGQTIGEVATISGKTQLYFMVWKKKYMDPEEWLRER